MVKPVLVVLVALGAGCVRDRYVCTSDAQCDVGGGGRCETDHRCSYFDDACATHRRYAEHGGDASGTCVDDRVVPANVCAEGQPPALEDGCIADVCAALPACCTTGWSSACVQQAQLRCDVHCDTRIAITATDTATELWDLRWDGTTWSATAQPAGDALAWLAPAPGTSEPRLAYMGEGRLTAGELTLPYGDHVAQSAASVDFDRTGRDFVAITATHNGQFAYVGDLTTGIAVETPFANAAISAWGDYDHDGFPDAVFGNGMTNRIAFIANVDGPDYTRALSETAVTDLYGFATAGQTSQVRSLEWTDVTGDGVLDLLIGGIVVRVHRGEVVLRDTAIVTADCNPVVASGIASCTAEATFTAAAVPSLDGKTVVWMASFPFRVLTTLTVDPDVVTPVPLPACTGCAPFVALVVRDLDGDHVLDVIAIDQDLGVWTVSPTGVTTKVLSIPTSLANVTRIRTSVSGAPIP